MDSGRNQKPSGRQRAAVAGERQELVDCYRRLRSLDPFFSPQAEVVLERLEEIGRGGMGTVHRVRDLRLGREAALKLLLPDRVTNARSAMRFRREVEITARLDHPGIPPVFDAGTTALGQQFLLMRLVCGDTMANRIQTLHAGAALEAEAFRPLLEGLLKAGEAVSFAHSRGIIHRDLKSENIMIGKFGEVQVLDWGLAKDVSGSVESEEALRESLPQISAEDAVKVGLTRAGAAMGTPGYMPPEQVVGSRQVDERSDVFALGAILTEILTGRPPVDGATALEVMAATLRGGIETPHARDRSLPAELDSIASHALAEDPADRYPSVTDLLCDLRSYLAGTRVNAHAYSSWDLVRRFPRERPAFVVGVVFALLLGLTLLLAAGLLLSRERESEARGLKAEAEKQRGVAEARTAEALLQRRAARDQEAEANRLRGVAETQRILAEGQEAAAEMQRRIADDALERNRAFIDTGRLRLWLEHAQEIDTHSWPLSKRSVPALEKWLAGAKVLLSTLPRHRRRLHEVSQGDGTDLGVRVEKASLESLIQNLVALSKPHPRDPWGATIPGFELRRLFARRVRDLTVTSSRARDRWETALRSISSMPVYADLNLKPIEGLLPIGIDAQSGLWEFWHVMSGEAPAMNQGKLVISPKTGIVLVLIPGGVFTQGSNAGRSNERPPHRVNVRPFMMSKYEFTQGQWERVLGGNPSQYAAGELKQGRQLDGRQPVESVSWTEANQALRRMGLRLPSEAQWEYVARAGTTSEWWTGSSSKTLSQGSKTLSQGENLADSSFASDASFAPTPGVDFDPSLEDGYALHAPVGSLRPNPFGLHDMLGNVAEWVQDTGCNDYTGLNSSDRPRENEGIPFRVTRGGCWSELPEKSRSAYRVWLGPSYRYNNLGFRPALCH